MPRTVVTEWFRAVTLRANYDRPPDSPTLKRSQLHFCTCKEPTKRSFWVYFRVLGNACSSSCRHGLGPKELNTATNGIHVSWRDPLCISWTRVCSGDYFSPKLLTWVGGRFAERIRSDSVMSGPAPEVRIYCRNMYSLHGHRFRGTLNEIATTGPGNGGVLAACCRRSPNSSLGITYIYSSKTFRSMSSLCQQSVTARSTARPVNKRFPS